ncbi:MAG: glycosyltransferase family 39 protein [Candidatus Hinthialibacter antarcticus]|nr:glycosyltransferase family 39 protein [Candidatus Hinthialibacter antarcticus]
MKQWLIVVLLLAVHVALLWHSASRKSATVDELSHLAGGLYAVSTGDFRITRVDPPFQNVFCAIFAASLCEYKLDFENESWNKGIWNGSGDRLLEANPDHIHELLMAGRLGSMVLSCALCLLIFLWAKDLWGCRPALCVLALTVIEPNLLAHGKLITTDAGTIFFYTLTGYLCWRFYQKPNWILLIGIGAAAAGAWLSKHSGLLLFPALFVVFLTLPIPSIIRMPDYCKQFSRVMQKTLTSIGMLIVISIAGFFTIWAGYGFEVGDSIPDRLPKDSELWSEASTPLLYGSYILGLENRIQFDPENPNDPFWIFLSNYTPAFSHWEGFFATRLILRQGHLGYLLGRFSYTGFVYYYPVLFLIKTPLPLLFIIAFGAFLLVRKKIQIDRNALTIMLVIPSVYLLILMFFNTAAIGYRHALPLLPYLLILCGGAAASYIFKIKKIQWSAAFFVLLAWCVIETLTTHPHYISYFNTLTGGSEQGRHYAVDSNLDWGQDLILLKEYIDEHDLGEPYLFYFGPKSLPEAYGVPHRILKDAGTLPPGTYIISATFLQGVGAGAWMQPLEIFRRRKPDAYITPALLLYQKKY